MPSITIGSTKLPNGFPPGTSFRLEWVAGQVQRKQLRGQPTAKKFKERRLVWNSKDVEFEITRFLDPGKYIWKAHKYTEDGFDSFSEVGEILVGMTEKQWLSICHLKPKSQKPTMTSDGVVFACGFPGCSQRTRSKISALLHENKVHYGVDLLKEEDPSHVQRETLPAETFKRGPGRPPKSAYGGIGNAD